MEDQKSCFETKLASSKKVERREGRNPAVGEWVNLGKV